MKVIKLSSNIKYYFLNTTEMIQRTVTYVSIYDFASAASHSDAEH